MGKEKYLADRKILLDAANGFIGEGKIEEANAKMKEIETLDHNFEAACKAQTNLEALQGGAKFTDITNMGGNFTGGKVVDTLEGGIIADPVDMYDSAEYRKAFMNNVVKGAPIPEKFQNVDANTKTSDVGAVIPTTVMEKIIEKLEATGMILPLVTRTAYKGGLSIPTSNVKPVASWVGEGAGSDKQNKTVPKDGMITFTYHKLRCAISVSLETDTIALPVFETTFTNNVVEAMVKAQEQAIISGTGTGQPKGILTETPNEGLALEATEPSYDLLVQAEAALPLEYEQDAVYCMTKKTFMAYIGIKDTTGQPVARVNYGIGGKPERALLGRPVVLCNYVDSYSATLTAGKVFAFLFNFKDYVLNTNYQMTVKKYEDNETDDMVTKAIMLVDGKVVDKGSLVTISKK